MIRWNRILMTCGLLPAVAWGQLQLGTGQVAGLYRQHCAVCHGRELQGGLGGSLIEPRDGERTDAELAAWIRDGRPETGMPAFKDNLKEPEIRALVIFIREMRQRAQQAEAPAPDGALYLVLNSPDRVVRLAPAE